MPFYIATYETRIGDSTVEQTRHIDAPDYDTGERWANLQALAMSIFSQGNEKITTCKTFETFARMPKESATAMKKHGFMVTEDPFTKEFMKLIKDDFETWEDEYPDWLVKEVKEA